MKAVAVVPRQRQVQLVEHEAPSIAAPTDVKLRMLDIGVCGTDRELCSFQYGTAPPGSEYLVIGHEALGEVVEVGPAVARVKPGDLAVLMVRRPCPHERCVACRSDRQDFCFTDDYTERGIKEAHGYMTEFVVDDEQYMQPVPPELRDVGVLVEPLTIAEKALAQVWQVQERLPWACAAVPGREPDYCHTAVVLGAGPVGLLGAAMLAAGGFQTYVYSRGTVTSAKAALVEAIGATYICSEANSVESLAEQVGDIDLVYEATGAAGISFEVMRVLGPNGVFVLTGVPGRDSAAKFDAALIMRNLVLKNQVVFGTVNAGREAFQAAIRDLGIFMQRWPDAIRSLITARHPIAAYRDVLLSNPGGIKHVIAMDGE